MHKIDIQSTLSENLHLNVYKLILGIANLKISLVVNLKKNIFPTEMWNYIKKIQTGPRKDSALHAIPISCFNIY